MAPLAKSEGGSGACGKAIFENRKDPDYRQILETFQPAQMELVEHPRTDMPGTTVSLTVNRSCK